MNRGENSVQNEEKGTVAIKVIDWGASRDIDACKGRAVSIGNFDGMHLGHQHLIRKLKSIGQPSCEKITVVSFDPHPAEYFGRPHLYLFFRSDLVEQLERLGVDELILVSFDDAVANSTPHEFLNHVLKPLNPKAVVVGDDFKYGKNRMGNIDSLVRWGEENQINIHAIQQLRASGDIVSSTRIRNLLMNNSLQKANDLLGRSFYVEGVVESGDARGRQIGFPTINIYPPEKKFVLGSGVYITQLEASGEKIPGITNIGTRPTFNDNKVPISVETHCLQDVLVNPGETVRVHFLQFVREEKKFNNKEALVEQISKDKSMALNYFKK
ncbi:MAG: riboflavin biosynthesis protein RibF [Bdellovibrionales bacterium]